MYLYISLMELMDRWCFRSMGHMGCAIMRARSIHHACVHRSPLSAFPFYSIPTYYKIERVDTSRNCSLVVFLLSFFFSIFRHSYIIRPDRWIRPWVLLSDVSMSKSIVAPIKADAGRAAPCNVSIIFARAARMNVLI